MDLLDGIAVILVAISAAILITDWRRRDEPGRTPWVLSQRDWEDDQ